MVKTSQKPRVWSLEFGVFGSVFGITVIESATRPRHSCRARVQARAFLMDSMEDVTMVITDCACGGKYTEPL